MQKRISLTLMGILSIITLILLPGMAAHAEENTQDTVFQTEDFTLTLPEDMFVLTPDTPMNDMKWKVANIQDIPSKLSEFEDMGLLALFCSDDGTIQISMHQKESSATQRMYSFLTMTEEELTEYQNSMVSEPTEETQLAATAERYSQHPQTPFIHLEMTSTDDSAKMQEVIYVTIINGYSLSLDAFNGSDLITDATRERQLSLLQSLQFTSIREKPVEEPMTTADYIRMAFSWLLLIACIAVPIIYLKQKSKRQKADRLKLTENLSKYRENRRQLAEQGTIEHTFAENATPYTADTITKYCKFTGIRMTMPRWIKPLILFSVIIILCLVFNIGMIYLLLCLVAVFLIISPVMSAPEKLEKKMKARFKTSRIREMSYRFFDNHFSVTGMQSLGEYAYIQILEAHETTDFLYLYYELDMGFIIEKKKFTKGTMDELRSKIQQQIGKKYRIHS